MTDRIPVAVLGATGTVGQLLLTLLADHPWFEPRVLAASERSAGRPYGEAVRWSRPEPLPASLAELTVQRCEAGLDAPLVFCALGGDVAGPLERACVAAGQHVVSNASSHRMHPAVPLVVPEVNPTHLELLARQDLGPGRLLANPNCSTIGLSLALAPLHAAFGVEAVHVVTLQALSGAGLPGVPSLAVADNVLPFIPGEEDKLREETARLLGELTDTGIEPAALTVAAATNRVGVSDGHTLCVSVGLRRSASVEDARAALEGFAGPPEVAALPSAPERPVVLLDDVDGPQPRLHRERQAGMAVHVGRLRPCPLFDLAFVALVHNTRRGAAGGTLLLAEQALARGLLPGLEVPAPPA